VAARQSRQPIVDSSVFRLAHGSDCRPDRTRVPIRHQQHLQENRTVVVESAFLDHGDTAVLDFAKKTISAMAPAPRSDSVPGSGTAARTKGENPSVVNVIVSLLVSIT